MSEPGIHEKMGPNDDYDRKLADRLLGVDPGPAEPAFPDLTDPATRERLKREIAAVERTQPSPHAIRDTPQGERLNNAISLLREARAELGIILSDATMRGVPRDGVQSVAQDLDRALPRLQRSYAG